MNLILMTPAPPGSKAGNRATAERWAALLREAGHQVDILTEYDGQPADAMIALHAWRSHDAIMSFRQKHPGRPLVTVLTGTDIYRFQQSHPEETLESMAVSHTLVGLHRQVKRDIPARFHDRLAIVLQSADAPVRNPTLLQSDDRYFDVCVIGHLREEKDSLRAAHAALLLPADSRIRILQAGKAHNEEWAEAARHEQVKNPRYQWLGELSKNATQALMSQAGVMVISSVMEGGANVVSEACRAGLPVIASDIAGNRGLLGENYPGYFPARDEAALAALLLRAETEPDFLQTLSQHVERKATDFTPAAEQKALLAALDQAFRTIGSMGSP
jgi:putative glycosyltransferase (TIGR04348 family)